MNIDYKIIDLENILNSGGSDINTLRNLEKKSLSRTGRTTRLVNNLIDSLFKTGRISSFVDHHGGEGIHKDRIWKIVFDRICSEHNPKDFIFNKTKYVIQWKGFDDHRSYQERLKIEIEKLRTKIENATKP